MRAPLVCFTTLVAAVRHSFPMEMLLKTHSRANEYVCHCSGVELARASASESRAARAVADRHGLPFPLFLHKAAKGGHAWASDVDRIKAFLAVQGGMHSATAAGSRAGAAGSRAGAGRSVPCESFESFESFVSAADCDEEIATRSAGFSPTTGQRRSGGAGPFHAAARRPLSLAARMTVWNTWQAGGAEAGSGPCHVCGRAILQQDFECGHVVSVAHGGTNSIDNLRPLCRTCNRSMGTMCLDDFKIDLMGVSDAATTKAASTALASANATAAAIAASAAVAANAAAHAAAWGPFSSVI